MCRVLSVCCRRSYLWSVACRLLFIEDNECTEVGLQMLDASCLQPLAERCTEARGKRLQMLNASCLQPLAEECTEVGRKRLQMLVAFGRCREPPLIFDTKVTANQLHTPMGPAVGGIRLVKPLGKNSKCLLLAESCC